MNRTKKLPRNYRKWRSTKSSLWQRIRQAQQYDSTGEWPRRTILAIQTDSRKVRIRIICVMKKTACLKNSKSLLSPGTKENLEFNMKIFSQPSVKPSAKRDYTFSLECWIVNPFWGRNELCFVSFFLFLFVLHTWNQNFFWGRLYGTKMETNVFVFTLFFSFPSLFS